MGSLRDLLSTRNDEVEESVCSDSDPEARIKSLICHLLNLTQQTVIRWTVGFYPIHRNYPLTFSCRSRFCGYEFYITESAYTHRKPSEFIVVDGTAEVRRGMKIYSYLDDFKPLEQLLLGAIAQAGFEKDLNEEEMFKFFAGQREDGT